MKPAVIEFLKSVFELETHNDHIQHLKHTEEEEKLQKLVIIFNKSSQESLLHLSRYDALRQCDPGIPRLRLSWRGSPKFRKLSSVAPLLYASQSHNSNFNFCCKLSGNQSLFFNKFKKTKSSYRVKTSEVLG